MTDLTGIGVGPVSSHDPGINDDELWMQRAMEQAMAAACSGEVPVGAVIVHAGRLIAEGHNQVRTDGDPTGHAEIVAMRRASRRVGLSKLSSATLYVTLEPCAMCAGAIVLARIKRLVFAAEDPKTGMCGSLGCLVQDDRLNHQVRLTKQVLGAESARLLRSFFQARR